MVFRTNSFRICSIKELEWTAFEFHPPKPLPSAVREALESDAIALGQRHLESQRRLCVTTPPWPPELADLYLSVAEDTTAEQLAAKDFVSETFLFSPERPRLWVFSLNGKESLPQSVHGLEERGSSLLPQKCQLFGRDILHALLTRALVNLVAPMLAPYGVVSESRFFLAKTYPTDMWKQGPNNGARGTPAPSTYLRDNQSPRGRVSRSSSASSGQVPRSPQMFGGLARNPSHRPGRKSSNVQGWVPACELVWLVENQELVLSLVVVSIASGSSGKNAECLRDPTCNGCVHNLSSAYLSLQKSLLNASTASSHSVANHRFVEWSSPATVDISRSDSKKETEDVNETGRLIPDTRSSSAAPASTSTGKDLTSRKRPRNSSSSSAGIGGTGRVENEAGNGQTASGSPYPPYEEFFASPPSNMRFEDLPPSISPLEGPFIPDPSLLWLAHYITHQEDIYNAGNLIVKARKGVRRRTRPEQGADWARAEINDSLSALCPWPYTLTPMGKFPSRDDSVSLAQSVWDSIPRTLAHRAVSNGNLWHRSRGFLILPPSSTPSSGADKELISPGVSPALEWKQRQHGSAFGRFADKSASETRGMHRGVAGDRGGSEADPAVFRIRDFADSLSSASSPAASPSLHFTSSGLSPVPPAWTQQTERRPPSGRAAFHQSYTPSSPTVTSRAASPLTIAATDAMSDIGTFSQLDESDGPQDIAEAPSFTCRKCCSDEILRWAVMLWKQQALVPWEKAWFGKRYLQTGHNPFGYVRKSISRTQLLSGHGFPPFTARGQAALQSSHASQESPLGLPCLRPSTAEERDHMLSLFAPVIASLRKNLLADQEELTSSPMAVEDGAIMEAYGSVVASTRQALSPLAPEGILALQDAGTKRNQSEERSPAGIALGKKRSERSPRPNTLGGASLSRPFGLGSHQSTQTPSTSVLGPPQLVVSFQEDWLCVPSTVLPCWEFSQLRPYSDPKRVEFVALCPRNDTLPLALRDFLRDVTVAYQNCGLGSHVSLSLAAEGISLKDTLAGQTWLDSGSSGSSGSGSRGIATSQNGGVTAAPKARLHTEDDSIFLVSSPESPQHAGGQPTLLTGHSAAQPYYDACRQLRCLLTASQRKPKSVFEQPALAIVVYVVLPFLGSISPAEYCHLNAALASGLWGDSAALHASSSSGPQDEADAPISSLLTLDEDGTTAVVFQLLHPSDILGKVALVQTARDVAFGVYNKVPVPKRLIQRSNEPTSKSDTAQKQSLRASNRGGKGGVLNSFDANAQHSSTEHFEGLLVPSDRLGFASGELPLVLGERFFSYQPLYALASPAMGVSNDSPGTSSGSSGGSASGNKRSSNTPSSGQTSNNLQEGVSMLHGCYRWLDNYQWLLYVWTDSCGELLTVNAIHVQEILPSLGGSRENSALSRDERNGEGDSQGEAIAAAQEQIVAAGCGVVWDHGQRLAKLVGVSTAPHMVVARAGQISELENKVWAEILGLEASVKNSPHPFAESKLSSATLISLIANPTFQLVPNRIGASSASNNVGTAGLNVQNAVTNTNNSRRDSQGSSGQLGTANSRSGPDSSITGQTAGTRGALSSSAALSGMVATEIADPLQLSHGSSVLSVRIRSTVEGPAATAEEEGEEEEKNDVLQQKKGNELAHGVMLRAPPFSGSDSMWKPEGLACPIINDRNDGRQLMHDCAVETRLNSRVALQLASSGKSPSSSLPAGPRSSPRLNSGSNSSGPFGIAKNRPTAVKIVSPAPAIIKAIFTQLHNLSHLTVNPATAQAGSTLPLHMHLVEQLRCQIELTSSTYCSCQLHRANTKRSS